MNISTFLPAVPPDITDSFQREFTNLESRFARQDWGPAELDGGRFAEAVLRYLEWKQSRGTYTPIGQQLNRSQAVNLATNDTSLPQSLRFHVTKCAEILLDIRNRRDVAHLGTDIDVDEMDARLVMRLVAWTLAEIIRIESGLPPNEIQTMIDKLSTRILPLVEEVGGDLIVVATNLKAIHRALVVLFKEYPNPINIITLQNAVKYQHSSRFIILLKKEEKEGIVHIKGEVVYLTGKGASWVEKNIEMQVEL